MSQLNSGNSRARRLLNAVALQHAVLCAECDVVSDSPHDVCMVCGSHSLVNICKILGGEMPKNRAVLRHEPVEVRHEVVLHFARSHRVRRRLSA
jgi:ribosomal protein L32